MSKSLAQAAGALTMVELDNCSDEFRKGFICALDFLDGTEGGLQHLETPKDKRWTIISINGNDSNETYRIKRGRAMFDRFGCTV